MTKICGKCKKELPKSAFWERTSHCKECKRIYAKNRRHTIPGVLKRCAERAKEYRKKDPKRARAIVYKSTLKHKYGIDIIEYERLLKEQNYSCAICYAASNGKRLCVDHDHKTGVIRGLLCDLCNKALGLVKDDLSIVQNLSNYLQKYDSF